MDFKRWFFLTRRSCNEDTSIEPTESHNETLLKGWLANRKFTQESIRRRRENPALSKILEFWETSGERISVIVFLVSFLWMYLSAPMIGTSQEILQIELMRSITFVSVACVLVAGRSPKLMSRYLDKLIPMLAFLMGHFFPFGSS